MAVLEHQQTPFLFETQWSDVRERVLAVDPILADILDEWSPNESRRLVSARYPFGAEVLDRGQFFLPLSGNCVVPIQDERIPRYFQTLLGYNQLPLSILLNRSHEVFRKQPENKKNGIFSLGSFGPGFDLGVSEAMGWRTPYTVIAGARSLSMLPRVSQTGGFRRLQREFTALQNLPGASDDPWEVFRCVAQDSRFVNDWSADYLFLTTDFTDKPEDHRGYSRLRHYVLQKAWAHSGFARKRLMLEYLWSQFFSGFETRGLKHESDVINTIKHLYCVASGDVPGQQPAIDRRSGPIDLFQKVYLDVYGLDYIPTILEMAHFKQGSRTPLYYSLRQPTSLDLTHKRQSTTSIIDILQDVAEMMDAFLSQVDDGSLFVENLDLLTQCLTGLKIGYFHDEGSASGAVRSSHHLPIEDPRWLSCLGGEPSGKFADYATFVRGCVRFSSS